MATEVMRGLVSPGSLQGEKSFVCDYSSNGSFLNEQLLPKREFVEIRVGDTLRS